MNWVIEDTYLQQAGYQDMDKLFGLFDITADGEKTGSEAVNPVIKEEQSKIEISYYFEEFKDRLAKADKYNYIETESKKKTEVYREYLNTGFILNEMLREYRSKYEDE